MLYIKLVLLSCLRLIVYTGHTMTKPELKISIVSDYICPFCYIAHKRLQCLREHYTLRVRWCFVEIHPETPAIGQAIDELNYTAQYWSALMENLNRVAEEEQMTLAPLDFTTNSRQALLLAESCKLLGPDVFNAVMSGCLKRILSMVKILVMSKCSERLERS